MSIVIQTPLIVVHQSKEGKIYVKHLFSSAYLREAMVDVMDLDESPRLCDGGFAARDGGTVKVIGLGLASVLEMLAVRSTPTWVQ